MFYPHAHRLLDSALALATTTATVALSCSPVKKPRLYAFIPTCIRGWSKSVPPPSLPPSPRRRLTAHNKHSATTASADHTTAALRAAGAVPPGMSDEEFELTDAFADAWVKSFGPGPTGELVTKNGFTRFDYESCAFPLSLPL